MIFGKYKGVPINEIPEGYLEWLIDNVNLYEPLLSAVYEALIAKTADRHDIKTVYRRMAFKYHPDRVGGSTEIMQAINEFYEEIINSGLKEGDEE